MEIPKGMTGWTDECLLLLKSIYGLIQAARQWHQKFMEILKKIGFKGGEVDPCLVHKYNALGWILMSVYIDDNCCVGSKEVLEDLIKKLQEQGLTVKVLKDFSNYLSCKIHFSNDSKRAWIKQPHLIKKLEEKFGHLITGLQEYLSPGMPGMQIVRPNQKARSGP